MVIVCERSNQWAVALRWVLQEHGTRVYETRHWTQCLDAWRQSPHSVLALQLRRHNLIETVRNLSNLRKRHPEAAVVVLAEREMVECEWIVREAGALYVARSRGNLSPLARLIQRILTRAPALRSADAEKFGSVLPWGVD